MRQTTFRSIPHWLIIYLAASLFIGTVAAAQTDVPNVDHIVAQHIRARGGEAALRAIRTLVFDRGTYREGDYSSNGDAVMMLSRPYYKLVGHPKRKQAFMEGYNGASWEWYADPGVVLRTTGAASEATRHFADVEGPFLDYANKGNKVQFIGTESISGRSAFQIRLTMMDDYATDFFIDTETFLITASRHTAAIHAFGEKILSETVFEDYRPVAGVLFPFRSREVEIKTGRELNSMQWEKLDANINIPAEWFSPPQFKRTPLQTFIEQLFDQRIDPKAMLWTYHVFRYANPGLDTHDAAETAGFQSLKMGQSEAAILLLERNARDFPNVATSAFGLGRAYAKSARIQDARREFQRAIQLDPKYARAQKALDDLGPP